jgi:hypothetical protein
VAKVGSGEIKVSTKRILRILPVVAMLACLTAAQTQEPAKPQIESKHFAKDGLSFDYPATWEMNDQSTSQMQFIQLVQPARAGDVEYRIRSPREWLKSPQKETEAKKLIHDSYVDGFVKELEAAGLKPQRSAVTTEIAGGAAEGMRIRVMDSNPGGMDSYFRVISDRFVDLSVIGGDRDITRAAPAWDLVRGSIKVEAPPEPKPSPTPAKKTP